MKNLGLLLALVLLSVFATGAAQAVTYDVHYLGTLGGAGSCALGVNSSNEVVGYADSAGGTSHAFLYSGGAMSDLGTLGSAYAWATAINDASQVAGYSDIGGNINHAFIYQGGVMTDINGTAHDSTAQGINSLGQVVGGVTLDAASQQQAYFWDAIAGMTLLPNTIGGDSGLANGINTAGDIVGWQSTATGSTHAFLCQGGATIDLSALVGDDNGSALAINESGQVAGAMGAGMAVSGFLYDGGVFTMLGPLNYFFSMPSDINDAGQIVGTGDSGSFGPDMFHGFLYDNGTMWDLNDLLAPSSSDWIVTQAGGINNDGTIVGMAANLRTGAYGAVLLSVSSGVPVPEPATMTLLGLGLGAMALRKRLRRR